MASVLAKNTKKKNANVITMVPAKISGNHARLQDPNLSAQRLVAIPNAAKTVSALTLLNCQGWRYLVCLTFLVNDIGKGPEDQPVWADVCSNHPKYNCGFLEARGDCLAIPQAISKLCPRSCCFCKERKNAYQ